MNHACILHLFNFIKKYDLIVQISMNAQMELIHVMVMLDVKIQTVVTNVHVIKVIREME